MKKLLGLLLLIIAPVLLWAGAANANSFRSGDSVTVPSGQNVDSTLWVSGNSIDIAGTVEGDVFCIGRNVAISGTVNGDIFCAAQTIRISGSVNGDIRLAGQTVSVSSEVDGSASIAAQSVSMEQSSRVGRDASIAAEDVSLNGAVGRDAALAAANIGIAGDIGRNVKASTEKLRLESGASVGGDLTYTSAAEADVAAGAEVAGASLRYDPPEQDRRSAWGFPDLAFGLYMLVSILIVALAAVLLVPGAFQQISGIALSRPLKVLLVGLAANLLFPVLFVVLLFTVLGIPLALLLLVAWLLVLAVGWLSFYYYIGRLVLRDSTNVILMMLAGTLIVAIVMVLPIIGGIVFLAALWMGTGMVLLRLREWYRRPVYDTSEAEIVPDVRTTKRTSAK